MSLSGKIRHARPGLTNLLIGDVLEYQERHDDEEHPAADEQRRAGAHDVAAAPGDGAGEQEKSDRQADQGGIECGHVGKAVFVWITPALDWRDQAQAPEREHGNGDDDKDDTQLWCCRDFRLVHQPPPME